MYVMFTLCACARGKVISFVIVVVVHTKIDKSRFLGVLASSQCCHSAKN